MSLQPPAKKRGRPRKNLVSLDNLSDGTNMMQQETNSINSSEIVDSQFGVSEPDKAINAEIEDWD